MTSFADTVKHSRILYNIYFCVGSLLIRVIRLFLKPDSKLIVFNSFGGRRYDDSPKAIYLKMLEDPRFDDYHFVWAFVNPETFSIAKGITVKVDTLSYFKAVLKARVWITNTTMTRALSFKGIQTFSLNTWHGSAIKKIGNDAIGEKTFVSKGHEVTDVYLAQGEYDRETFSRAFGINKEQIKVVGLPRNDELTGEGLQNRQNEIREKLNIPKGKKVILYAPTFRDYVLEGSNCVMSLPVSWVKWQRLLGDKYVVLMRAHHAIVKSLNIEENDFVKDVSLYPHLNDLMIASNMLISDYSSIFFDYAILGKPMFCFAYDFEEYRKERGLYFDIRKELENEDIDTEDKLLAAILNMDEQERCSVTKKFQEKYVQKFGTASVDTLDLIYGTIK